MPCILLYTRTLGHIMRTATDLFLHRGACRTRFVQNEHYCIRLDVTIRNLDTKSSYLPTQVNTMTEVQKTRAQPWLPPAGARYKQLAKVYVHRCSELSIVECMCGGAGPKTDLWLVRQIPEAPATNSSKPR